MCEWFCNLQLLDRILFVILIISLSAKWIGDIVCWIFCRRFNRDKEYKGKCIYLDSKSIDSCSVPIFNKKYFENRHCNKNKCPGYRVSNYSIDEIKQIYRIPFLILTLIKLVSELSTVILIIRTLLMSAS